MPGPCRRRRDSAASRSSATSSPRRAVSPRRTAPRSTRCGASWPGSSEAGKAYRDRRRRRPRLHQPRRCLARAAARVRPGCHPDRRVGGLRRSSMSRDDLPGGTFDAQFTFAQALTEAARRCRGTAGRLHPRLGHDGDLISEEEVGGEAGARRSAACTTSSAAWPTSGSRPPQRSPSRSSGVGCSPRRRPGSRTDQRRRPPFVEFYRQHHADFPPECPTRLRRPDPRSLPGAPRALRPAL